MRPHESPAPLGFRTSVSQHLSSALTTLESSWLACASPAAFASGRLLVWVVASQDWCWTKNVRSSCKATVAGQQEVNPLSRCVLTHLCRHHLLQLSDQKETSSRATSSCGHQRHLLRSHGAACHLL